MKYTYLGDQRHTKSTATMIKIMFSSGNYQKGEKYVWLQDLSVSNPSPTRLVKGFFPKKIVELSTLFQSDYRVSVQNIISISLISPSFNWKTLLKQSFLTGGVMYVTCYYVFSGQIWKYFLLSETDQFLIFIRTWQMLRWHGVLVFNILIFNQTCWS